jgi:hypothetical protein
MSEIEELASLIRERNEVASRITALIGRPSQIGHIGEWIASKIFDIELERSAVAKGCDGRFCSGQLQGKTVNVKFYAKREGMLAIREDALPDHYLVLTGPRSMVMNSRGDGRPWHIDLVYLFNALELYESLCGSGVRIDACATSICAKYWTQAEIYPAASNSLLALTVDQCRSLSLFGSGNALIKTN